MTLNQRDFNDLPEGWSVQAQDIRSVHFLRPDRDTHVRLFEDDDYDFWVSMWDDRDDSALFQQRFNVVGDAIRTTYSVMDLYNSLWSRTVEVVMDDVSDLYVLGETIQELRTDVDEDEQDATDQIAEKVDEALREGDYEAVQEIVQAANSVAQEHLDTEE